jgi:hypothetical protein
MCVSVGWKSGQFPDLQLWYGQFGLVAFTWLLAVHKMWTSCEQVLFCVFCCAHH